MLMQSEESSTQNFAYSGQNQIFAENTGTSSVMDNYYPDGLLIASYNGSASASTVYYHQDALGSVRLVSSSSESTIYTSNYQGYGSNYGKSGTSKFQYADKPSDSATGLYYEGARWYDPASARFMTEDTSMGTLPVPLSLNKYIYALDNPMKYTDPTGRDAQSYTYTTDSLPEILPIEIDGSIEYESFVTVDTYTVTEVCEAGLGCVGENTLVSSTVKLLPSTGTGQAVTTTTISPIPGTFPESQKPLLVLGAYIVTFGFAAGTYLMFEYGLPATALGATVAAAACGVICGLAVMSAGLGATAGLADAAANAGWYTITNTANEQATPAGALEHGETGVQDIVEQVGSDISDLFGL